MLWAVARAVRPPPEEFDMSANLPPIPLLGPGDAVLVVDVQRDFCPGGALPIPEGDAVVPVLNRWLAAATEVSVPVIASRDWHPAGHCSFTDQGGEWPPHCIQDSSGAAFHPDLALPAHAVIVSKATSTDRDAYSAFDGTGLAEDLERASIKRLWIGGLAQDVCVRATVLDALEAGFEVHLIPEATRPVTAEGGETAAQEMASAGAHVATGKS
jgi:nicotinamidase/pyrazinamidase